jgi:hypothetical protein
MKRTDKTSHLGRGIASVALCGGYALAVWATGSELVGGVGLTFALPVGLLIIWGMRR